MTTGSRILLLVAALLCGLCVAIPSSPAHAQRALVLKPPVVVGDRVHVAGKVRTKAKTVVIERKVGRHWREAAEVRVRRGAFEADLPLLGKAQRLRAVTATSQSRVRKVAAGTFDSCGLQPTKADGTRWSCTFVDDFEGADLDRTKWVPQTIFATGEYPLGAFTCYRDDPSVVAVSDGALHLTVRNSPPARYCTDSIVGLVPTSYLAGMVSTHHLFSQQYGRFEARFRTHATDQPGLQEGWWLWPDDREGPLSSWPLAGEIDIAETYSQYPGLAIPYLHYNPDDNGGPIPGVNTAWNCAAERGGWNTYTLVWTATYLEAYVNDTLCLRNTSGNTAFQKKYILNLTQALGYGSNAYQGTFPLPATMDVDYVRTWQ